MFVGHFAIAFLLWRLFPQVPLPVVLIAVSFPDLLWSLLVPAGIEKVRINPDSPLQKFIVVETFPYSHSLVLGSALSLPIGLLIAGVLNNPVIVPVFVAGSASHFFFSSRRRHTSYWRDWSSDVCSSDLRRQRGGRDGHA